jgi:hypothetical protein
MARDHVHWAEANLAELRRILIITQEQLVNTLASLGERLLVLALLLARMIPHILRFWPRTVGLYFSETWFPHADFGVSTSLAYL